MHRLAIAFLILVLALTRWNAHDPVTWWLEVAPVFLAMPFLWVFGARGRLSNFLLLVIVLHAVVLMIGGHYTYALAPPGEWVRSLGIGARNNYDKLGHFMQGFTPVLVLREVFLRTGDWTKRPVFLGTLAVFAAGGISALYEVIEMTAALAMGQGADAFLGTQGYVWDTQTDMATALVGALVAAFFLSGAHARSVERTIKG
jgi:putative membrane protein